MIVLQRDYQDCGISCISYLIKHYKGNVSLGELRLKTVISHNGTTLYHMIETLKKYNFQAKGLRLDFEHLGREHLPSIVHLVYSNGLNHYVVLKKVLNSKVLLMDPAKGNVTLKIEEFLKIWSGVVIVAIPKGKMVKNDGDKSFLKQYIEIIKPHKKRIILLLFINLIAIFLSIILTCFYKYLLEVNVNKILFGLYLFGFITVINLLVVNANYKLRINLDNIIGKNYLTVFLKHLSYLNIRNYYLHKKSEILTRINEFRELEKAVIEVFLNIFFDLLLIIGILIIAFILDLKIFCLMFFGMIIYLIVNILTNEKVYLTIKKSLDVLEGLNSGLVEYLGIYETMKYLHAEKYVSNRVNGFIEDCYKENLDVEHSLRRNMVFKQSVLEIIMVITNSYLVYLIAKKTILISDFVVWQSLLLNYINTLKDAINYLPRMLYLKNIFSKISEFISLPEEKFGLKEKLECKVLECKNLSYSYNEVLNVIENVNVRFEKGINLLVGFSGMGKSTLCKIIDGQLDNYHGLVLIDGLDIQKLSLETLRSNIVYLSQNEELINGTIKENIVFGRDIKKELYTEVCKMCHVDDFALKKYFQDEELITVDNFTFSSGEKQRLILARTLLSEANILILDECLSEVNIDLEIDIIKNIKNYFKDKIIIYISHKKLPEIFTKIVFLKGGDENASIN